MSAALIICAAPYPAGAQVIQRPERPISGVFGGGRPPDPSRARQDLTLSLSTLGGYDDNLTPGQPSGGDLFVTREPGYTGYVDGSLEYRRGRQTQLFEIGTRGFVNTFRNAGLTPAYGGELTARLVAPMGRRVQLELSENARNEPFYALGAFGPLRTDVGLEGLPATNSANGFSLRRSWTSDSAVSLQGRWPRGSTLRGSYHYGTRDFRDDLGDGHSHGGSIDYLGAIGRRSGLRASYRQSTAEYLEQDGMVRPIADHSADLGFQHEHQVSRTRRWSVSLGAGATYVDTVNRVSAAPLTYTTPSAYGNTRLDVGRTWSISADYRRGVSVLEGLTAESFVTDSGLVRLGGFVGSRAELAVSAAYSEGVQSFQSSNGRFESYTGTVQLRYLVTRWWSAVVSHNFYRHELQGIANLPPGFPERLDRNAVQLGMTFDLPLYGAYTRQRPQQPGNRD